MKKISILILISSLCCASIYAQKDNLVPQPAIDALLKDKIDNFRLDKNLNTIINSEVLRLSSQHHSYYMATTKIVSHYQTMNLVSMSSIYSPRKRVNHFSSHQLPEEVKFSEIVIGIKCKTEKASVVAGELMNTILNSENFLLLIDKKLNSAGISTIKRNNRYYLTIKFGVKSNQAFTILE